MAVEAEALDNIREAIELVLEDSMSRVKREGGKLVQTDCPGLIGSL